MISTRTETAPEAALSQVKRNGNGHDLVVSRQVVDPKPRILALIPAYNEEKNVGNVVRNTLRHVDEVIVVDDGSRDATVREAELAGATVVRNLVNRGLGPTMRRGYLEALKRGAHVVVQLDADGQYDPAEIPLLLKPIADEEADMVLGSRLNRLHYDMPAVKRFGNKAFSSVLRTLTGADVADGQTGFRAIRREVLESGVLPTQKFSYTQEMIIRAAKEGWRVKSVDTNFYARYDGKSRLFSSPLKFALRAWAIIIRTMRDYHPMQFFAVPGLVLLTLGMIAGGIVVSHIVTTGGVDGRMPTLILSAVLVIAGLQFVFMGLLADMLRRRTNL